MTARSVGISSILVVCTGNICRSPLAEAVLRQQLPSCQVVSAGLDAPTGRPVHEAWLRQAEQCGLDLSVKRSQRFTPEMGIAADIVLCMEAAQCRRIIEQTRSLAGRVFLLSHWSDTQNIEDPILGTLETHSQTFAKVRRDAEAWADTLKEEVTW